MMVCPSCRGVCVLRIEGTRKHEDCILCYAQGKLVLDRFIELVRVHKATLRTMFQDGWTPEEVFRIFYPSASEVPPVSRTIYTPGKVVTGSVYKFKKARVSSSLSTDR